MYINRWKRLIDQKTGRQERERRNPIEVGMGMPQLGDREDCGMGKDIEMNE